MSTLSLPIRPVNLGSSVARALNFHRDSLWKRMPAPMGHKAMGIPVYLVNPDQMDLLYPPERLRYLNPRSPRVREWADWARRREGGEELPGPWELSDREMDGDYRQVVATGLYVSRLEGKALDAVLDLAQVEAEPPLSASGPAIFLCPERILGLARREGISPDLVLDNVYYHELGHALMDTGPTPYKEGWGRTIEESLANWIAYRRFQGKEALQVQKLIRQQPLEYQGYAVFDDWSFLWKSVRGQDVDWWLRGETQVWWEAREWWFYGVRRGFVPHLLPFFGWVTGLAWVEAWREAKRRGVDLNFWPTLATRIILHVLELE